MDLASYADLALELVNTQNPPEDALRDLEGLQALLAHRPHLGGRIAHRDLDAMRELRAQIREIFVAADAGSGEQAVDRLNSLLIQHPIHPLVSDHDGEWHLHLNEAGSIPDRYAARAAMGLAVQISERGVDRLGVCRAPGCERVFFDATANKSRSYCSDACAGRPSVAAAVHPPRDRVTAPVTTHRPRPGAGRPEGKTVTRDGGQ
ncbi:CGNR zinc finger domain-containing protein [Spirillospora sp. CA-294931]|uniref:CGNR zinc finger domain-containing protein n=1 Tax=Spirillospora sp. CA-294931 TaxID=3240042 RepID=UPI003D8FEC4F